MALRSTSPFRFARDALCAAIAASFGLGSFAQTTGLAPVHGSATLGREGNVTTITTVNGAGGRSVLNWTAFGVAQGETVRFQQPDAASTSINRVLGGNPSAIAGTLWSNGHLVLVNPAGIAAGSGAVVDTAGFTASTLGLSRENAIAGRLLFGTGDLGDFARSGGGLQVQGDARVLASRGDIVLIGRDVGTGSQALLQATGGDVVLAAGRTVEISGRGLEGIVLRLRAPDDRAVNLGTLRGDSVAIFAGQLQHSGLVQARSVSTAGGKVLLQATDRAEISGRIEATAGTRGGSVLASADRLTLKSDAVIDVSHPGGGGEILVGGGIEGKDERLPDANQVVVEQGVLLRADATLAGDGGLVVAWSNGDIDFRGAILARGAGGGAPGLAIVSALGRQRLDGSIDVNGDGASGVAPAGSGSGNPGSGSSGSGSGSSGSGSGGSASDGSGNSGSGSSDAPGGSGNAGGSGSSGGPGNSGGSGHTGGSGNAGGAGNSGGPGNSGNGGNAGSPGGSGNAGNSGGTGNSGNSGSSGNSGGSGTSTAAGGSDTSGSGSTDGGTTSGSSGAPQPDPSLSGPTTEVRAATERTANATVEFLARSTVLLAPGVDDVVLLLQPASTPAESDARVLGAGPGEAKDKGKPRGIVVTGSQCRPPVPQ